jgi:hypothetical protein
MADQQIVEIRREITAAQERGDHKTANSLYARSLELQDAARLQSPAPAAGPVSNASQRLASEVQRPAPVSTAVIERFLTPANAAEQREIETLRYQWRGALMAENLGYARWLIDRYLPGHVDQIPDRIAVFKLAALVGRQVYADLTAGAQQQSAVVQSPTADYIGLTDNARENELERRRAEIRTLQEQGRSALANRKYVELQQFLEDQGFDQPIVNGRRTA